MNWTKDKKEELALIKFLGGDISTLRGVSESSWREYEVKKAEVIACLRQKLAKQAGERVGSELQSPSYRHSVWSEAGRREGKVIGNINDYTRDRHPLASELEQRLVKEYQVRGVEAFVTASGMAAFTTIRLALQRMGITGTIAIGQESYFQNREQLLGCDTVTFDERDSESLREIMESSNIEVVMVDSLSNTEKLAKADILAIARTINKVAKKKVYLVVDNSMLGPSVGYKDLWKLASKNVEIIVWESLNKFFQYGLDRVTGGVVWARGKTANEIFYSRMHAGTIMPDVAVAMMPRPNAKMMQWYQQRMQRNRGILQEILSKAILPVCGDACGVTLVVSLPKISPFRASLIIGRCIREAKKRGVQLSAGSSFGLPNTRIYLTARKTSYARMFLRIAVGWESELAMCEIGEALKKVLS